VIGLQTEKDLQLHKEKKKVLLVAESCGSSAEPKPPIKQEVVAACV
jgi:hypothetical protein